MRKFTRTGWGFAKKGSKILGHYGTRVNLPLPTGEVDFVSERSEFTKSGEGTIFKVINGTKKCAFTLAEVLIVLAVLGVVAAITIPDLLQDYREKALITALKKSYTIFSQAVDMAIAENGPVKDWDIGVGGTNEGHLKIYNILKPYLRIEEECGLSNGCFAEHYESLFNTDNKYQLATTIYCAKGVLTSGTSFCIGSNGTGCQSNYCGRVFVDVNGKKEPNKAGVDFFVFNITEDGLLPAGQKNNGFCRYNDNLISNGLDCTYWAIKHENMDYLRKSGDYYRYKSYE